MDFAEERRQREAKNRAKEDRIAERSVKVAELWLKGHSVGKIAESCELSVKNVRSLITKARALWLERRNIALTDAIAEQLKRIDLTEATAWEDYAKSRNEIVERSTERGPAGIKTTRKVRERTADARFLDVVIKCVDMRCKLLGIYKPPEERSEMEVWGVVVAVDTPEQANAIMEYSEFQGKVVDASSVVEVPGVENPENIGSDQGNQTPKPSTADIGNPLDEV
jgi:hypothetical protein